MLKGTRQSPVQAGGFTLVELMMAVGLVAVISGAILGFMINTHGDFTLVTQRSEILQEGQAAMARMIRTLRQARQFTQIVCTSGSAAIEFTDTDGTTRVFRHNAAAQTLEYGSSASVGELASGVVTMTLTCYDAAGQPLADPVYCPRVRSLGIQATFADPANPALHIDLSDRLFWPKDLQRVAINEILCNPVGILNESRGQWIELYNPTSYAIDLAGWRIWTGDPSSADALISHPIAGNGSLLLPAQGYAVISARSTDLYIDRITGGDFESPGLPGWTEAGVWTQATGAHGGGYAAAFAQRGSGTLWQSIQLASSLKDCGLVLWERTTAASRQTALTATIRTPAGAILATAYAGPMSRVWTSHAIDLSAYAGQSLQVHLAVSKTVSTGLMLIDDVTAIGSTVPADALRLSIQDTDDRIGRGLNNDSDIVAITDGTDQVETVAYLRAWGLGGEGTTLARISTDRPADARDNWAQGPLSGTSGWAN